MLKKLIIILSVSIGIFLLAFFLYVKNIDNHYSKYVRVVRNTNLYSKKLKKMGTISKNVIISLEKKNDNYFKVKNYPYYIYYKDVKKEKKNANSKFNYLIFNKNIKTSKMTNFYNDNNKKVLTINKGLNQKLFYQDASFYYTNYFDQILKVKKEEAELVDHENTKEIESEYVSVIYYKNILDNCTDNNCISKKNVKEQLKTLSDMGYYTISLDEYEKYLDKNIRLKEKAVLLITDKSNDIVKEINNSHKYLINIDNGKLKFEDLNQKSTKDSNKNRVERYVVTNDITLDVYKKILQGEELITNPTNEIPVLNYHFFYDSSLGEGCNESICLDVRDFREQLDYLKNNGYRTVTMQEFTDWMYSKRQLPEKSVLITVDDGAMGTGKHNGNKLIPILEEYKMHATLFLIAGWWNADNYRSEYLDIQSHTFDMHQYGDCGKGQVLCASKEEVKADLKKSLEIVDNDNSFCFPFYRYDEKSIEAVKEAGFKLSFIGGYKKASRQEDKYHITRYPIHKDTSMKTFIDMVS